MDQLISQNVKLCLEHTYLNAKKENNKIVLLRCRLPEHLCFQSQSNCVAGMAEENHNLVSSSEHVALHLLFAGVHHASSNRLDMEVVGWVDGASKHWVFTQETAGHVLCQTRSQCWLILTYQYEYFRTLTMWRQASLLMKVRFACCQVIIYVVGMRMWTFKTMLRSYVAPLIMCWAVRHISACSRTVAESSVTVSPHFHLFDL